MTKKIPFEQKIRNNPANVRFDEMCKFLDKIADKRKNRGGSHVTFKCGQHFINIQRKPKDNKLCKEYQVKQVIKMLDENNRRKEGE